jgi:RNA polymerase sigma factor (sigma-70 family)
VDRELARRLDDDHGPRGAALDALIAAATRHGELPPEVVEAAKAGDMRAVEHVVRAHLPRISAMARRYATGPHVEQLELVQEGVVGLLQALKRYDPAQGTPLWDYARPTVQRAMRRLVGELGDAATLSESSLRHLSRMKGAEQDLTQQHHRVPSRAEVIERSGVDREEAERLLAASRSPRSLQEPITAEDGGVVGLFGDLVTDPRAEDEYERVLDRIEAEELKPLLSVLSRRERDVLRLRYGLDGEPQSRRKVAEALGVSESRVRDIERRALAKLRRAARDHGADRDAVAQIDGAPL